jgi:hypothetical protein
MLRSSVAIFCLLLCGMMAAHSAQIVLREQLNQRYANELVTYSFPAGADKIPADAVRLTGPTGPIAAQLSDVELWPNTKNVKTAKISFLVSALEPLTTNTYTISNGTAAQPATDLRIARDNDQVEITTGKLGVRLLLGEQTYPAPTAAKDVPGPLRAMRLANGAWAGGSNLTGEVGIKGWTAKLTDAGPVFARVEYLYTFADDNTLKLTALVAAGDSTVRWEMAVKNDAPAQGIAFRLPPVPGVKQAQLPKGYGQWARDRTLAVAVSDVPFCFLSPNSSLVNIFADNPPNIVLSGDGGAELQLRSRDPGAWVDPAAPLTYGGQKTWELTMIPKSWENWQRKRMPVSYAADGTVTLQASLAKGGRKWLVSAGAPAVGDTLDWVKGLVLDWPADPKIQYPHLFLSKADLEGKRPKGEEERIIASLRGYLEKMGNFDVMRYGMMAAGQYDAVIDSPLLSARDRALFRAQLAYLAYILADPMCWSTERGFHSGNPNMACSYTATLGVLACTIPDHPMAKTWTDYTTRWTAKWLADDVGPNGEWMPEGSHYGHVSLVPMMSYAITAQRAGFHDFLDDPRLKQCILYFAKYSTPRDPQRANARVSGAYGRGTSGDKIAEFGMAARMYAGRDAAFSATMQWIWAESGYPKNIGDSRLGGFEAYYLDKALPAQAPAWGSELFPALGGLLRAGFGTENESYVNVLSHVDSLRNLDMWTPGIGGISQWFGRGKPLSTCFTLDTGYNVRHELLRDGVRLGHNWGAPGDGKGPFGYYTTIPSTAFAAFSTADYVRATLVNTTVDDRDWFPAIVPPAYPRETLPTSPKLEWTRQLLFVKDADPLGPAYLVLRDTTRGGQPTVWQFWTLSEKIGTPAQLADVNFLADKPGKALSPSRELPMSDRYTAIGQHGVHVDYFIASPANTPRHTLRYGGNDYLRTPEYQDLLHLQLPGDGAYYVVLYPRSPAEAAPVFTTLAGGKIIKITNALGTDYSLLAAEATDATADGVTMKGTAASMQQRATGAMLVLGAAGEVRAAKYGLTAPGAASLQVAEKALTLTLPAGYPGGMVTLTAPGRFKLDGKTPTVRLTAKDGQFQLTIPAGITRVTLIK